MTIHSNGASIPHTSRCEILTRGTINDGDTITIDDDLEFSVAQSVTVLLNKPV